MRAREQAIRSLHRARPRSRFVRASVALLLGLCAASWFLGPFDFADLVSERRLQNLARFAERVVPRPLRGEAWDWGVFVAWVRDYLDAKGWEAMAMTLAISVAAIVLAGSLAWFLCVPAARTLAPRPVVTLTRLAFVSLRAIPEYVWAFLFLAVLGPTAWPAVLALGLHNLGILGRLQAEVLENLEPPPLDALRGLGAGRRQVIAFGARPAALGRFLLYFFYRWETCVREATVLGMLGIVSLGYYVRYDARPRDRYDEMVLLILLGSALVLAGDALSALARGLVRQAR